MKVEELNESPLKCLCQWRRKMAYEEKKLSVSEEKIWRRRNEEKKRKKKQCQKKPGWKPEEEGWRSISMTVLILSESVKSKWKWRNEAIIEGGEIEEETENDHRLKWRKRRKYEEITPENRRIYHLMKRERNFSRKQLKHAAKTEGFGNKAKTCGAAAIGGGVVIWNKYLGSSQWRRKWSRKYHLKADQAWSGGSGNYRRIIVEYRSQLAAVYSGGGGKTAGSASGEKLSEKRKLWRGGCHRAKNARHGPWSGANNERKRQKKRKVEGDISREKRRRRTYLWRRREKGGVSRLTIHQPEERNVDHLMKPNPDLNEGWREELPSYSVNQSEKPISGHVIPKSHKAEAEESLMTNLEKTQ